MFWVFISALFLAPLASSQVATKVVIDFCSSDGSECGLGVCDERPTGNRCVCPDGWMGRKCQRPCQDVYRSCIRWKEERRCHWTRPISPFFTDNCALSCGQCVSNGRIEAGWRMPVQWQFRLSHSMGPYVCHELPLPLPPILDNLAWLVGRWETRTTSGERFPENMGGAYKEVLEIQISDVPSFDRPPVNISTYASTLDGLDVHREVGFMTSKPFNEDTGFVEIDRPKEGDDLVAIESVGNNGLIIIEEGILKDKSIKLATKYKKNILPWRSEFKEARRMFILVAPDRLEERVILTDSHGNTKKWLKRYRRTFDYLQNFVFDK